MNRILYLLFLLAIIGCGKRQTEAQETSVKVILPDDLNSDSVQSWYGTVTSASSFNCFGVFVDLRPTTESSGYCTDSSNGIRLYAQRAAAWGYSGTSLSLTLPVQENVSIHLIGMHATSSSYCGAIETADAYSPYLSRPRLLSTLVTNIAATNNVINLNGSYSNSVVLDNCTNGPFNWSFGSGYCNDYESATSYSEIGSGTSADPYMICNANQLNDIGQSGCNNSTTTACGSYYELMADVDLSALSTSFVPIGGTTSTPADFYGSFDGNNYSISNFSFSTSSTYAGLFRSLGTNGSATYASISNLTLVNPTVTSTSSSACLGALVGKATGSSTQTHQISDITISGGTISGSGSNIGGIVGQGTYLNITHSSSSATVSANSTSGTISVGGILGNLTTSGDIATTRFSGAVSATNTSAASFYVCGILGYASISVSGGLDLGQLSSTGTIGCSTTSSISCQVGGILGYFIHTAGASTISNNAVSAAITIANGTSSSTDIGGLFGKTQSTGGSIALDNNYFAGSLTITGNNQNVGGLVGNCYGVANSYNYSFITGTISFSSGTPGKLYGTNTSCSFGSYIRYSTSMTCTGCSNNSASGEPESSLKPATLPVTPPFGNSSTSNWSNSYWSFSSSSYPTLSGIPLL